MEFCKYTLYHTLIGIEYIHGQNVLWRDVKSDNILCRADGVIKFCDFDYSGMKSIEN